MRDRCECNIPLTSCDDSVTCPRTVTNSLVHHRFTEAALRIRARLEYCCLHNSSMSADHRMILRSEIAVKCDGRMFSHDREIRPKVLGPL